MNPKEDFERSGLSAETIEALGIRMLSQAELQKVGGASGVAGLSNQQAYLISYFDVKGERIPDFYRVRFLPPLNLKGKEIRYLQPQGSTTHIYIPPLLDPEILQDPKVPLIITEGEKKAAKACQEGIWALGLGGVNSWRSRKIKVDISAAKQHGEKLTIDLHDLDEDQVLEMIAPELTEIVWENREVLIAHDSDAETKNEVGRAVFEFGNWLQGEGANVRQVLIPDSENGERRGLDDFLCDEGADAFWTLEQRLPQHPRLRAWIRRLLDARRLKRSDCVKAAKAILNSLDSRGKRFVDHATGSYYYWDERTTILHGFRWESAEIRQIRLSTFGSFIQDHFGVGASDTQLMGRIADLFASGRDLTSITPRRVSYATDRALYYQLSDSDIARVTSSGIDFVDNGHDGVLFLAGQVEPLSIPLELVARATRDDGSSVAEREPKWLGALRSVNLQPVPGLSIEQTQLVVAALFYLSPWLRRWQGLMLPVELVVAEPNSGKTFLYNLRKAILTGRPSLDNPPLSQKDWYAQLANSPGIWICDNLGEPSRELREHMSDELARLVTDPDPKVEMRKLYTTMDTGQWPIDSTFAITSIRSPFWKPDILQRSMGLAFEAIPEGRRDPMWYRRQLSGTGRAEWVVDQLLMIRNFFREVNKHWDDRYLSSNRLVHFEQALLMMGRAMGRGDEMQACIKPLFRAVQEHIVDSDPIMEALRVFVEEMLTKHPNLKEVQTQDVVNWVEQDLNSRFSHLNVLGNAIRLGRYINTHKYDIAQTVGLVPYKKHNQTYYQIIKRDRLEEVLASPASQNGKEPHA